MSHRTARRLRVQGFSSLRFTKVRVTVSGMAAAARKRSEQINIKLRPDEREMLEELAEDGGRTIAGEVRVLIRKAHAELEEARGA